MFDCWKDLKGWGYRKDRKIWGKKEDRRHWKERIGTLRWKRVSGINEKVKVEDSPQKNHWKTSSAQWTDSFSEC